jgi:hypothetical protein
MFKYLKVKLRDINYIHKGTNLELNLAIAVFQLTKKKHRKPEN